MKHVTVVGGGIAGCACALALAKAGRPVRLVERSHVMSGASGAALGGLFPYTESVQTRLAAVQRASVAAWPDFARELAGLSGVGRDVFYRDWDGVGQVNVAEMAVVWRGALARVGVEVCEGVEAGFDGPALWCGGWSNRRFFERMELVEGQALRLRWEDRVVPVYGNNLYVMPGWQVGEVVVGSSKVRLNAPRMPVVRDDVTAELLQRAGALVPGLEQAEVAGAWVGQRPSLPRGTAMLPLVRPVADGFAVAPLGGIGWCLAPAVGEAAVAALADF